MLSSGLSAQRRVNQLKDYFILTKPVVVALLLVTTFTGMVVAGKGLPPLDILLWTLLSGAMAAGGAHAVNQYIDRDLDKKMARTANRPVAAGRIPAFHALVLGLALCSLALLSLVIFVNLLSACLTLLGMLYYIVIYSIFLKKATRFNIVIGGAAGAIPPLVGWTAITGSLDLAAFFLFGLVFLWTPPHFWSLALIRRNEYAAAGVPMLPVECGEWVTRQQIFGYSLGLVAATVTASLWIPGTGMIYHVIAVVSGLYLVITAAQLLRQGGDDASWKMYKFSSLYLGAIFLGLMLEVLV